jgi:hypothetical protein
LFQGSLRAQRLCWQQVDVRLCPADGPLTRAAVLSQGLRPVAIRYKRKVDPMSNAQDYRTKSAEFARLASKATSLKYIKEFRHRAQAFRSLAENEEWVEANRDKIISNRAPADGRIGYGAAEDRS